MPGKRLLILIPALALGACSTIGDLPTERLGEARLQFASGLPAGTAQLFGNGSTVSISLGVVGVEPGTHGFHLHMVGRCTSPDFTSAGGHLNPAGKAHGHLAPMGQHLGDLPNVTVGNGRTGTVQADIAGDYDIVISQIFDGDGTAVVVHADPDDYRTDPTGNAGSRVACGVIERRN